MRRLAVLLLPLVLSSCMTIWSQQDHRPGPRVYSGTWAWFDAASSAIAQEKEEMFYLKLVVYFPATVFALADLPLSIVADTLILPFTIPEQIKHGDFIKFWQEVPSTANLGEQIKIKVQDTRRASQTVIVLLRVDDADPKPMHIELDANGDGTATIQAPHQGRGIRLSYEDFHCHIELQPRRVPFR